MNKPKDMQVDQTNALLSQVQGLSFKIPGLAEDKQPGAAPKSAGVDPESLMVEDTNNALAGIMGPAWDNMSKPQKKDVKPLTEAMVISPAPAANPILPSQTAGVSTVDNPLQAPKLENEQLGDDAKIKAACMHLEQAKAALVGLDGADEFIEDIQGLCEDLEDSLEE